VRPDLHAIERKTGRDIGELKDIFRSARPGSRELKNASRRLKIAPDMLLEMEKSYRSTRKRIRKVEEDSGVTARTSRRRFGPMNGRRSGPSSQERAGRGEPAPGRLDREEVHEPGPAVPRPDPGGEHRPHEGRGQVRVAAGLQVQHLCDWWIRQAITRAIADQARTIRIPVHMIETMNKLSAPPAPSCRTWGGSRPPRRSRDDAACRWRRCARS